ncbi:MAG: septal ring lytic transglycosylase RlpA family protein [Burkholderiales bacterium]|nr:septal ring lytic transglycosylase RlpA family protein [Burkholderiales bacterium]
MSCVEPKSSKPLPPSASKPAAKSADETRGTVGLASYYAEEFRGRTTANGERYDPAKRTAAHRHYPFGTRVRVKNFDNGQSVVVRINDRGPHKAGRVIDLSAAAARELGLLKVGTAKVSLEVVEN